MNFTPKNKKTRTTHTEFILFTIWCHALLQYGTNHQTSEYVIVSEAGFISSWMLLMHFILLSSTTETCHWVLGKQKNIGLGQDYTTLQLNALIGKPKNKRTINFRIFRSFLVVTFPFFLSFFLPSLVCVVSIAFIGSAVCSFCIHVWRHECERTHVSYRIYYSHIYIYIYAHNAHMCTNYNELLKIKTSFFVFWHGILFTFIFI